MDSFDPNKIIDFSKNYYEILGINSEDLPNGKNRAAKVECSNILDKAFRNKARTCHPDFGGTKEAFLDIVRARRILEDPYLRDIYDGKEQKPEFQNNTEFAVDWSKIGNYRKGTPEDTVGFSLFFEIVELKEKLQIVPAFIPKSADHNYEWDFALAEQKVKLSLSIVNDEDEVLRLTDSSKMEESLPFKIYVCIPRASLTISKNEGSVQAAYNDYNLLETTSLNAAKEYISIGLEKDLELFRSGELQIKKREEDKKNNQSNWVSGDKMKTIDKSQLDYILKLKSFNVTPDEKGADFLDNLPTESKKLVQEEAPELPF
jgi:curved DNA-binding protein CbpA